MAQRGQWLLPLAIAAGGVVIAAGLCGDDEECQHEMATKFAPEFRLDKDTITKNRCLPGHPATVYWARKAGDTEDICESDISKLDGGVPLFYYYEECGDGVVTIDYHIWYSHQPACLELRVGGVMNEEFGAHRADWERVVVHISNDKVARVRYHQHSGSYTKSRGNVEFVESDHPVVYVGQDSHGSYHDRGGTGNCLYFQDHRRFEDERLKVQGWKFLLSIRNTSSDLPEWFHGDSQYYDGFPNVASLKGRSGCSLASCKGKDSWVELTETCTGKSCGCRKSDYCDDVEFGAVAAEAPCGEDSWINDLTDKGKDLLGDLWGRGSAQVSFGSQGASAPFLVVLPVALTSHLRWI